MSLSKVIMNKFGNIANNKLNGNITEAYRDIKKLNKQQLLSLVYYLHMYHNIKYIDCLDFLLKALD